MPVTIQNEMGEAGLVKFDFLGLKTLTVLQRAVDFKTEGEDVKLESIPLDDKKLSKCCLKVTRLGCFNLNLRVCGCASWT